MTETYQRTVWVQGDCQLWIYCADKSTGLVSTTDYLGNTLPTLNPLPLVLPPENPSGVAPLISDACGYVNAGVELSAVGTFIRKSVTGRGRRKIIPANQNLDEVTLTVPAMFIRKGMEYDLTHLFVPQQALFISVKFINPTYSGMSPNENDVFNLQWARAQQFRVLGQEQDEQTEIVKSQAVFIAESLT